MMNAKAITATIMPSLNLFLDSSALIAGIISSQGAARVLLLLSEDNLIKLFASEQVITEVERNIARKAPKAISFAREIILQSRITVLRDPSQEDVNQNQDWISHPADVPILVAAVNAHVNFMISLDAKHFLDDAEVSRKCGLRIGTPGDALAWVREQLAK